MRRRVESVSLGVVSGLVTTAVVEIVVSGPDGIGGTMLTEWAIRVLPVVVAGALAGAGAVVLVHLARWSRKRFIRTPKEHKFRRLHSFITEQRDVLPPTNMLSDRYKPGDQTIDVDRQNFVNALVSELKTLDVHLRLDRNHISGWQGKFEELAEYSRTGDLNGARAKFLD